MRWHSDAVARQHVCHRERLLPATGTTDFRSTYGKCNRPELCKHSFLPGNRKFSSAGPLFVPTRKANAKAFPVPRRVPSIRPDPQTIKALPHPKEIPRRRPPGYCICNTVCVKRGGLRRGRSRRGRFGETGLSLRGGSLQGLLLWRKSLPRGACAGEAGLSKVFSKEKNRNCEKSIDKTKNKI